MQLQVKGRNVEISPQVRQYAEQKLAKLEKQLHELTRVELELAVERNPSIHECYVAEGTIWGKGATIRAREATVDMRASIDGLTEKLLRQVKEYREKRTRPFARKRRELAEPPA